MVALQAMTKQGLLRVFEANSISECAASSVRPYNATASEPVGVCRRVDALGRPFDPNEMEAISSLPAGDPGLIALGGPPVPPGSVAAVAQVGPVRAHVCTRHSQTHLRLASPRDVTLLWHA